MRTEEGNHIPTEDDVELVERYRNALMQIAELEAAGTIPTEDDVELAERYQVALAAAED